MGTGRSYKKGLRCWLKSAYAIGLGFLMCPSEGSKIEEERSVAELPAKMSGIVFLACGEGGRIAGMWANLSGSSWNLLCFLTHDA